MNQQKEIFKRKYKDGDLILQVVEQEGASDRLVVSFKSPQQERGILSFYPELMNTKQYGRHAIGIYDSWREETGEVAFQMHGNISIDRKPFPYGIILCLCDDFTEPFDKRTSLQDVSEVKTPEFMEALKDLCFQYLRSLLKPTASPALPLYFVFYGRDHVAYEDGSFTDDLTEADPIGLSSEEHQRYIDDLKDMMRIGSAVYEAAQGSKEFGLFRCVAGLTTDEICFLMVAGELNNKKLKASSTLKKQICSSDEFPEIVNSDDLI